MVDYHLRPSPLPTAIKPRLVASRPSQNLRKGGGRKDSPGWNDHKRRANRKKLNALRPHIKTGVTIRFPSKATPEQLKALNECSRNFCKEYGIPARCVWEGPSRHQHMALGIVHDRALEALWRARIGKRWLKMFNQSLGEKDFLWKPEEQGEKIASYLSKTHDKEGKFVKGAFEWLTFPPTWETGFRALMQAQKRPKP